MAKRDDYRVVEDPSTLKSMREVADALETQFGMLPEVVSGGGGAWVNAQDLRGLSGIGISRLADNFNVDFTSFVLSAKELEPETDNPLLPRRLQVGIAGAPMIDPYGSRYIFRLTAAEPTRVPESLDEVRDQVEQDAWVLAAYETLLVQSDQWLSEAVEGGLEAVAGRADTSVIDLPATARRVPLPNGLLIVPPLPMIGQSDGFIEAFFGTANTARQDGEIADAPADRVTGVVGVDRQLALTVYRVDDYEPMTRDQFREAAAQPILPVIIDTTILAPARVKNPLSMESLAHRMNYVDEGGDSEAEDNTSEVAEAVPAEAS